MSASSSKNAKSAQFGNISSSKSGKGAPASAATTTATTDAEASSSTEQIPLIRSKDNAKQLPTYHAALQRSADDYLAAEDLDAIQLELETLLSNVAMRFRMLKTEYDSLDKDERRNDRRSKHATSSEKAPLSPTATSTSASATATPNPTAATTSSSSKRKRDETSTGRKSKHATTSSLSHRKQKTSPLALNTEDSNDYALPREQQKPNMPKNDTPNKFWLSVEPYCMPITNEDLRLLDDILEQYNGALVPPIPELGEHYSNVWATEDIKEIQQASNPNVKNENRLKPHNNTHIAMMKKADPIENECITGPLTQRLVSALIEEQLIHPNELTGNAAAGVAAGIVGENSNSSSENTQSTNTSSTAPFRSLSMMRNCIGLEKRVKKELIELGILEINDFPNNDEDEINSEIQRLVAELSTVADFNSTELKRLHQSSTEEIKRLEVKRRLDVVDQEILEAYKRNLQGKTKRKSISQEEQQEICRLTTEQRALSDQLERMQTKRYLYE